jgi:hypothetical protein
MFSSTSSASWSCGYGRMERRWRRWTPATNRTDLGALKKGKTAWGGTVGRG